MSDQRKAAPMGVKKGSVSSLEGHDYPIIEWKPPPKDHPTLRRMTSMTIPSYQPRLITNQRRMLEDLCRDLVVNNDHIHVVEQRLRQAIALGKLIGRLFTKKTPIT